MIDQGDINELRFWALNAFNRQIQPTTCSRIIRVTNGVGSLRAEISRLRNERDAIIDFYLGSPSVVSAWVANPDSDPSCEEDVRRLRRMAGLDEEEYSHI